MKKVIVTTTINSPTKAIEAFQAMEGWELVVAGDKKTPRDYHLDRGIYIGPEEQEKYDPLLSEAIGWNCIQRRNFAFLWAHDMKADIVALVDDDNIPLPGWGEELLVGREVEVNYYETDPPAFDPIGATNYPYLWHRGFPLQLLSQRDYSRKTRRKVRVDIQADFWNGDPDIDAFCRLEHAPECQFDPEPFPMASNRIGPFDSQNTFITGKMLKDYMVFPHVGRMDDIWPGYYAQAKGWKVVYNRASVYQQRNVHDLIGDLRNEYIGYENNLKLVQALTQDAESITDFLPNRTAQALQLYRKHFAVD
jgi:glycosyltransferase involved in cell wall biosynthesis